MTGRKALDVVYRASSPVFDTFGAVRVRKRPLEG